jgi:serine/threonine protein phosphatase PrpC
MKEGMYNMKAKRTNWAEELALQHCCLDPRIDSSLRRNITLFITKAAFASNRLTDAIGRIIVFSKYELPNSNCDFYARGETVEEEELIQNELCSNRDQIVNKIRQAAIVAVKTRKEIILTDLSELEAMIGIKYFTQLKKVYLYRTKRIVESFSGTELEMNKKLATELGEIYRPSESYSTESAETRCMQYIINNTQSAFTATCIGRPKIIHGRPQAPSQQQQEDRVGLMPLIELHPSWKGRLPEFLALLSQKITLEVYNRIPAFNPFYKRPYKENRESAGSTLTILLAYGEEAGILSIGDSPAIYIDKNQITGKNNAHWLTWPHQPKGKYQQIEVTRIGQEGGTINNYRVVNKFGDMAVSRAIGDLAARGMSDIGSITITRNLPNHIYVLGSDGLFDFLSLQQIEELSEKIKFEDLSHCFCNEAYRNPLNHDNISGIVVPGGEDTLAYVADGHGGFWISECINQALPEIFADLAMREAPPDFKLSRIKKPRHELDQQEEKNSSASEAQSKFTFFGLSANEKIETESLFDSRRTIEYLEQMPYFFDDSHNRNNLESALLNGEMKNLFFIQRSHSKRHSCNHYIIHQVIDGEIKQLVFYIPSELPMAYEEYDRIVNKKNIICSQQDLERLLSNLQASQVDHEEFEVLTQSPLMSYSSLN